MCHFLPLFPKIRGVLQDEGNGLRILSSYASLLSTRCMVLHGLKPDVVAFPPGKRPAAGPFLGLCLAKTGGLKIYSSARCGGAATTPKRGFQLRIVTGPEEPVARPVGAFKVWRYL